MDGWSQILGMLQIAGSQDPPAKTSLDTHEVTAVVFCKYKLQFAWLFPVYTLLLILFPMVSIYAHISYFFHQHLLLAAVHAVPHLTGRKQPVPLRRVQG